MWKEIFLFLWILGLGITDVGKSVAKSKRSDQIDLFHTGHAALITLLDKEETNLHTKFCHIFCMHACMHEWDWEYLLPVAVLSSIYRDRSQYSFFFNGCCYTKKYTSNYTIEECLTLLLRIRLRDHNNLHLLSVSHDACSMHILIPIVIGSFYLSLYKTFYNLKHSFLLDL